MKTLRLYYIHFRIVFKLFSAVHTKTMKMIENSKGWWKSIFCGFAASFSKVCAFSENDPSTIQQYYYNNIVFKSFHFEYRFQKISFSVKKIIVFYRFPVDGRRKRKEKFSVLMKTI